MLAELPPSHRLLQKGMPAAPAHNLVIDSTSGILSATNTEHTEGDGIDINGSNVISLDIAQASIIGGVKISGNNLPFCETKNCGLPFNSITPPDAA